MSFLSLHLPSGFKVPADLNATTPDENAFIITAGFHAFQSLNKDKASHRDKSLQENLDAYKSQSEQEHLQREEHLQQQHAAELQRIATQKAALEKQLAAAQATAETARAAQTATNAAAGQAEAEARKRAQDGAAEQIRRLEQERERAAAELKTQRETAAAEREKLIAAERETSKHAAAELKTQRETAVKQLAEERERAAAEREKLIAAEREERKRTAAELKTEHEKRIAAEREMRERLTAAEREASERLTAAAAEAQKREDELRSALERAQGIKSCPALKGAANESVMTDILTRAFGGGFLEKQLNAGDHLLQWEGFKLMIEDKIGYLDGVPKKEIDKAHDDFVRHRDCDALLFFSAESSIKGHTRPGDFDVGVWDGRPVLFVGKLNAKEDKVLYLQTLQPIIRELIKLTKKAAASGLDATEALEGKLSTVRMLLKSHEAQVAAVRNSANAYARSQKSAWEMHKVEIAKMEASFSSLLKEALTDDVAEEDAEESAEMALLELSPPPKPAEPKKEPKCGACGQMGHMKSQKSKCPLKGVVIAA